MAVFPDPRGLLGRIFGKALGDGETRDPGAALYRPIGPDSLTASAPAAIPVPDPDIEAQIAIFAEPDANGDSRDAGDGAPCDPGEVEQARLPGPDGTRDPGDAESPQREPGLE